MIRRRRYLSTADRVRIFRDKGGVCAFCRGRIKAGEAWDLHHVIELELGGADDDGNLALGHRKCHRAHTAAVSQPAIAKAKRVEAKHLGAARQSRRPMAGSRRSPWKQRMDGTVERRP